MRRPRIVVVGSTNMDLVVRVPSVPRPGQTVAGSDLISVPGGKGANQAVAAARLGADVVFVGRCGSDAFGQQARRLLEQEQIDTRYLIDDPAAPHGVALIVVDQGGQNAITVSPGANAHVTPDDVLAAEAAIAECDLLLTQFEIPLPAVDAALSLATRHGRTSIVNPAPARRLESEFLAQASYLTPNELEAIELLGLPYDMHPEPQKLLAGMVRFAPAVTLVTLGDKGAVYLDGDELAWEPARAVDAIDSTAAGDCFTGALAVALAEGKPLRQAAAWANLAASISVTRVGAQTSLPMRDEVAAASRGRTSN